MFADGRSEIVQALPGCRPNNLLACNPFSSCSTWYGLDAVTNAPAPWRYYPDGNPVTLPAVVPTAGTGTGWGHSFYQNWPSTSGSDTSGLLWQGYQAGLIYNNVPFLLGRFTHRNYQIVTYLGSQLQTTPCSRLDMTITFQLTDSSSGTPFVVTQTTTLSLMVEETPNSACDVAYNTPSNPPAFTNPWAGYGAGRCPYGCDASVCGSGRDCIVSDDYDPERDTGSCSDPRDGVTAPYGVNCGAGCFDRITILDSGITAGSIFTNPNNNNKYFLALLGFVKNVGDEPIYTFDTAEFNDNSADLYAQVTQTCVDSSDCDDGVSCTVATCVSKDSPLNVNKYPANFCTYELEDSRCPITLDSYQCADRSCTETGCKYTKFNNRCNAYGPCISATCSQVTGTTFNCVYGTPNNNLCNYLTSQIPGCIPICNTTGYCGCMPTTTTTTTTKTTTPTTTRTTTTKTTTTTTSTTTTPACIQRFTTSFNFSSFGVLPNSGTNLVILSPTDLFWGYTISLTAPSDREERIRLFGGSLTYPISCGNNRPLTVNIPNRDIVIPAGSTEWFPSNDITDLQTYTGSYFRADQCFPNGNMTIARNAQFTFAISSWRPIPDGNLPFLLKFHWTHERYPEGCCGVGTPFSAPLTLTARECNAPTTTTTKPTTTSTTKPTTTSTSSTTKPTTTSTTKPTTTRTTTTTTTNCQTRCRLCNAPLELFLLTEPPCDDSCGNRNGFKVICVYDSSEASWYPEEVAFDLIYTYFLTEDQQRRNFFAQTSQDHPDQSGRDAKFDCECRQIPPTTTTTPPPPPPEIKPRLNCISCNAQTCWASIGYDAAGQVPDSPDGFTVSRSIIANTNNYMTIQFGTGSPTVAGILGNFGQPTLFSTLAPVASGATITFSKFATVRWHLDGNILVIKQGGAAPCPGCDFPGQISANPINSADVIGVTYTIDFSPLNLFCGGTTSRDAGEESVASRDVPNFNYTITPRYFVADIPACSTIFKPIVEPAECTPTYSPIPLWVPYPTWDPRVQNPDCFWDSLESPYVIPLYPRSLDGRTDCTKVKITIQLPRATCPQVTLGVDDIGGIFDVACRGCDTCRTLGMLGITSKCPTPQYCSPLEDGTPTSWNAATCLCEPCVLECPPRWTPSSVTCKCRECDENLCTPGVNWNTIYNCSRCFPCPANPEEQCAWNQRVYKTLDPPVFFANPTTGCPECGPCPACSPGQTYTQEDCTCGPCTNCLPGCDCSCPECPIGFELDLENINPALNICPCIPCDITCPPGSYLIDPENKCLGCNSCPPPDCNQYGIRLTEDLCGCEACPIIECATGFRIDPDTGCGCVECLEQCRTGTILSEDKCSCIPVNITEPPTTPGPCPDGVIDACGVCNGEGTSCLGCDGQPGTGRWYDPCRVPCGDGSTCNYCKNDECSVCTLAVDICGVCGGNGSTCLGCDGLPPTLTRPPVQYDWCGVCGGNGTSCLGCDGQPNTDPCPTGITPGAAAAVASLSALAALSALFAAFILARFRSRPELLYEAWDNTLREYITEIESNPLYMQDEQESNPLWQRT